MDVKSTHTRNPLMGWDITATATAGANEKIVRAQIIVDDFPEYDQSFDPPINNWQESLQQQGEYPGDNTVRVVITDDQGNDAASVDSWST